MTDDDARARLRSYGRWPVTGVRQGPPSPSPASDALAAAGYSYVADVDAIESDADPFQQHLNNLAALRMFNELRVAFAAAKLAPDWPRYVFTERLGVVVRELHVLYESEADVGERFVGGTHVTERRGKAAVMEQALLEATSARPVARAWLVQLVVRDGKAIDWPAWYWDLLADAQGAPVPSVERGPRPPWGPS